MKSSATKILNNKGNGSILAAIAIVVLGLALGLRHLNEYPAFIHAWAQADWYSLALGFRDNGFDFFHPQTLIYNKQFPGTWATDYGDAVTSADFPVVPYVAALSMQLLGTAAPWVFRGWTLLCSLVGCWFLYLMCRRLTGSSLRSLLVVLVAMTSPLYAYYFAGFMPSCPALSLVMAGLWTYVVYRQEGTLRYWHWTIALLGVATLVRTSQAVPLVAICGYELLRIVRHESVLRGRWQAPVAAVAAIVAYWLWNRHLAAAHGTLFLGHLVPAQDGEQMHDVISFMREHWRYDYFTRLQHWLVAGVCVAALVVGIWRAKSAKSETTSARGLDLWWLAAIWWVGEVCFFFAMLLQYHDHDYYYLDSFFLPVIFTFALALRALPSARTVGTERAVSAENEEMPPADSGHSTLCPYKTAKVGTLGFLLLFVGVVLLGGTMYNEAKHKVADRYWEGDRAYICLQHFQGSDRWLDEQGVPRDAKILAFLAYPQNGPFIQMGRKGYSVMWWDDYIVEHALEFPYDYVVIENDNLNEKTAEAIRYWELVADNGTLSLYKNKK